MNSRHPDPRRVLGRYRVAGRDTTSGDSGDSGDSGGVFQKACFGTTLLHFWLILVIATVLALSKAHALPLNTAHVLRLNKADVLALSKAHV